eukprot:5004380-Alexandrium_andersonii.AAC.1
MVTRSAARFLKAPPTAPLRPLALASLLRAKGSVSRGRGGAAPLLEDGGLGLGRLGLGRHH